MRTIFRVAAAAAIGLTAHLFTGQASAVENYTSFAIVPGTVTCSAWQNSLYEGPVLSSNQLVSGTFTTSDGSKLQYTISGRNVTFTVLSGDYRVEVVAIKGGADTGLYFFDEAKSSVTLTSPRNQTISTLSICGNSHETLVMHPIPACPFNDSGGTGDQCPASLEGYVVFAFNVDNPDPNLPVSVCQCSNSRYQVCSLDPTATNFCGETTLNGPLTSIVGACTGDSCSTFCYQSPTGKWQCVKG